MYKLSCESNTLVLRMLGTLKKKRRDKIVGRATPWWQSLTTHLSTGKFDSSTKNKKGGIGVISLIL